MNYFLIPLNARMEWVERQSALPARQGGSSLSLFIESGFQVEMPSLPALFVFQTGVWLMVKTEKLEPRNDKFCYHIEAVSLASLQDLSEMIPKVAAIDELVLNWPQIKA